MAKNTIRPILKRRVYLHVVNTQNEFCKKKNWEKKSWSKINREKKNIKIKYFDINKFSKKKMCIKEIGKIKKFA